MHEVVLAMERLRDVELLEGDAGRRGAADHVMKQVVKGRELVVVVNE